GPRPRSLRSPPPRLRRACGLPSLRLPWSSLRSPSGWGPVSSSWSVSFRVVGGGSAGAPPRGRRALPALEGARERVELLEAQEEGDLAGAEVRVGEQGPRRAAPHVVEQLLVGRAQLPEAPLQRARAQAEAPGDLRHGGALSADAPAERRAHVVG